MIYLSPRSLLEMIEALRCFLAFRRAFKDKILCKAMTTKLVQICNRFAKGIVVTQEISMKASQTIRTYISMSTDGRQVASGR